MNYLALALPLFLLLMGLEYAFSKWKKKSFFSFFSSVSNISTGLAERLLDVFATGLFYYVYDYLHRHYAIFDIKSSWWLWCILLLLTDFIWYWYHRLAHEVNVFWAVHVVHHQSEDFNYTVSARITIFQAIVRTGFWSVLPVIGFPADMITTMLIVHGVYPFFIHTRTIGNLGWLEHILVTPSHHRVHHASNEKYLDKNYGDVFIFWDKLFGTFQKEEEAPVYGLTKQLKSHSFLWQHFHFFCELIHTVYHTPGTRDKLRILFGKPDLVLPSSRLIMEYHFRIRNNRKMPDKKVTRYIVAQIVFTCILLFFFLLYIESFPGVWQWLVTAFVISTVINCGALMEQRRWVFHVEYIRALVLGLALTCFLPDFDIVMTVLLCITLSTIYYTSLQRRYVSYLYGS